MNYKEITKTTYNTYPNKFDSYFQKSFDNYTKPSANLFLKNLNGKNILDLGSGPGNDAKYFKDKGFNVHCVDISEQMIRLCKEKGLKAEVMDIENLKLNQEYDGIWANASLLHLKKRSMPKVIEKLKSLLKPEGILFIAVKEGNKEIFEKREKYPNTKRFFSYFTKEEIKNLFKDFEEIHFSRKIISKKSIFIRFIFKT